MRSDKISGLFTWFWAILFFELAFGVDLGSLQGIKYLYYMILTIFPPWVSFWDWFSLKFHLTCYHNRASNVLPRYIVHALQGPNSVGAYAPWDRTMSRRVGLMIRDKIPSFWSWVGLKVHLATLTCEELQISELENCLDCFAWDSLSN